MNAHDALLRSAIFLATLLLALPARATERESSCRPRSAAEWATKCATREGREDIERLLGDCRRLRALADLRTAREACEVLLHGEGVSACDRARRQLLTAALNVAAGRLNRDCCVQWRGREVRLGDVLGRHSDDCHEHRNCEDIREFLALVNDEDEVHDCARTPTPPEEGCCTPRSKGFWHRQCLGIGAITPGRGRGGGPGLHPAFTEEELRRIISRANRRFGGRCDDACEALDEENYRTARGRALAQYAALVLNFEAGFLDGCGRGDGEGVIRRVERLMDAGDFESAKDLAERVNVGQSVRRCPGTGGDDEDSDDRDDDDDDGHGHDKDKKTPPGHSRGKGKP
jgi:hypothetical protein